MDRDEAIQLLKSGSEGKERWNQFRERNSKWHETIDLTSLDITDVDLSGFNLNFPDLSGSNFSKSRFVDAKLDNATFSSASLTSAVFTNIGCCATNFSGADCRNADFSGVRFYKATLGKTDFTRANLEGASFSLSSLNDTIFIDSNLQGARLGPAFQARTIYRRTNLRDARFGGEMRGALFDDVDLSECIGLEKIVHNGPSSLTLDTLFKSKGELPNDFLLGCGVPESLLDYVKSLPNALQPIQYYSCFISYSHADEEFAQRLHGRLRQGGLRIWYAPEDMKSGQKIHHQIDNAIRVHDKLLLVLSNDSMNSEWVKTEIAKARKREIKEGRQVLFPIRLVDFETIRDWECFDADTGKDSAREIREYFIPDFSAWKDHDKFEAAFERLLADLKQSAEPKL